MKAKPDILEIEILVQVLKLLENKYFREKCTNHHIVACTCVHKKS